MRAACAILIALTATLTGCNKTEQKGVPMSKESLIRANKGLVTIDKERIEAYAERHQWD